MPVPRIVKLVHRCKDCPNYRYNSGGSYICDLTGEILSPGMEFIPAFCPLPLYPSGVIADLEHTNKMLRHGDEQQFEDVFFTYAAKHLGLNIRSKQLAIIIPYGNSGKEVTLSIIGIREINIRHGLEIIFSDQPGPDYTLQFYTDGSAVLREPIRIDNDGEWIYQEHEIKKARKNPPVPS